MTSFRRLIDKITPVLNKLESRGYQDAASKVDALLNRMDAASTEKTWITMKGSPVLIAGGKIVGGAGGKFNGTPASSATHAKPAQKGPVTKTPSISDKEKTILKQYGEGNSYNINKFLADPKTGKAEAKKNFGARASEYIKDIEKDAKTLDGVIDKSSLSEDTDLYRGVSDFRHIQDAISGLKSGGTFSLTTFSSTSRDKNWASDFMKGKSGNSGMLKITAKAGAKALDMDEYARHKGEEQEVLLGRNTKFKFDRYDEKTRTCYVTVE